MALIEAKDVGLKIGSKYVVQNINWQINRGENWVLFGLNGCGKTTLLSILAAYQTPSEGEVRFDGEKLTADNREAVMKKIGFVSSSFFGRYLRSETVLDSVLAGGQAALGLQEAVSGEDVRRAKALLGEFGLKSKARYPYDTLSKGQQQMVLIARALMGSPDVLVLDEPCSGLDIIARERFLHMMQDIAEKNQATIVYVTHHTEEILPFFDKAALMKEGKLYADGDLPDVFNDTILSTFFETKARCIWSEKHFFIDLDLAWTHQSEKTFTTKGGVK